MVNGITGPDHCLVASEWLPRQTDARLQGLLVKLNADAPIGGDATGAAGYAWAARRNEPLKAHNIKIRLAIFALGFGGYQSPCKAKVQSEIGSHAPIILHVGTKQFEAAASGGSKKSLVVSRKNTHAAEQ